MALVSASCGRRSLVALRDMLSSLWAVGDGGTWALAGEPIRLSPRAQAAIDARAVMTSFLSDGDGESGCVAGEHQVALRQKRVTGEAARERGRGRRLAVIELAESPAA